LLELALLRFAESGLANPAPAVSPTAEQVAAVLTPLESAAALRPALPPVYALQAEVWMRAGTRLSTDQLTHLRRAVTLFPESSLLAVRTAQLLALYGEPEAAREVIRRARAASEQPAALRWFDAVEASLAAEGATATPGQEPQLQRSGSQR
jgi:predicted Zn-dependent protease